MPDPEVYWQYIVSIGAILGVIGFEYLYMTNAENVRLLYIILLIPVGLIVGGIGLYLTVCLIIFVAGISAVAAVVLGILALIGFIVGLLHDAILWTN